MGNAGTVIATDIRAERLRRVEENCLRLGISIVRPMLVSGRGDDLPAGPFDAVLGRRPLLQYGRSGQAA